jgi:protein-L-isoaspartate(D-aspartate) O-methyltransferase
MSGAPAIESIELERIRRYFAEEIRAVCNLRTESLVEALASVPREQFLGAGPWVIRGMDADLNALPRPTPSADPRHVYHNVSIAIDPARQLFNGQPGLLASWFETLQLKPGERILHLGCGTGYYSAIMAHMVGPTGSVTAIEIDAELAQRARQNLRTLHWITVREGDGTRELPEMLDAIVINAGVTHPLPVWLDSLREGGRMVLPMTFTVAQMPVNIGKGGVLLVTRQSDAFAARFTSMVAIYSCAGVRDAATNELLMKAFSAGNWLNVRRIRRDTHELGTACWLHGNDFCLTLE